MVNPPVTPLWLPGQSPHRCEGQGTQGQRPGARRLRFVGLVMVPWFSWPAAGFKGFRFRILDVGGFWWPWFWFWWFWWFWWWLDGVIFFWWWFILFDGFWTVLDRCLRMRCDGFFWYDWWFFDGCWWFLDGVCLMVFWCLFMVAHGGWWFFDGRWCLFLMVAEGWYIWCMLIDNGYWFGQPFANGGFQGWPISKSQACDALQVLVMIRVGCHGAVKRTN